MVKAKSKHAASQEDHKIQRIGSGAPITEREIKQESREYNPMANEYSGTEQTVARPIRWNTQRKGMGKKKTLRIPKRTTVQKLPKPSQPAGPTSRKEKSFETVHLEVRQNLVVLTSSNRYDPNKFYETQVKTNDYIKIQSVLLNILKLYEIDTFQFTEEGDNPEQLECWSILKKCAPFRFKTFSANKVSVNVENFLKNCDGVENVFIKTQSRTSFRDTPAKIRLLSLPAVINAKMFQVTGVDDDQELNGIEQENGPMLPPALRTNPRIARNIKDRLTNEKANETRIRTNDESKHVLGRGNGFWPHRSMGSSTRNHDGDLEYGY